MKILTVFLLALSAGAAQSGAPPAESKSDVEEQELSAAVAEAGSSPIDFVRVLEKHLRKYPDSSRKPEVERALVKAAIENKDGKRIIEYGERVLAREPDDVQVLDRVTRALLSSDDKETSARALKYARHYGALLSGLRDKEVPARMGKAQWREEIDRGVGRALSFEARALGNLGRMDEAVAAARKGWETFPSVEAAREVGRWLVRSGKEQEALESMADAFAVADQRVADAERLRDRTRLGELYVKLKGSEKGLGDLILAAYDRTSAILAARRLRFKESDPNAHLTNPMEFTLSGLDGAKLPLASLLGKTVVFDFWATWCGPCRAQYPLYEQVKERFRKDPNVVFLSVNTDENRDAVAPFLASQKWDVKVWFEDGLSRALEIASIPTTIIVDRHGKLVSRMNGYVPDRFVDMLTERIRDTMND